MTIDPKIAFFFNIAALVLAVLAGATWWSDIIGPKAATVITGVMSTAVSAINVVLSAYSSPKGGPLTK